MRTINISDEDYEFLKELQHELNTQTNDGNADPVYWGVIETYEEFRGESGDYGGEPYITFDDGKYSLKEAIEEVEEALNTDDDYADVKKEWGEVDKSDPYDVRDFMVEHMGWDNIYDVIYLEKVKRLSENTGAFLTKRACQEYIDKYKYNHDNPHTYAMTAYRNFELGKLLNILKTVNL